MSDPTPARWDVGDIGCGRLAAELATRVRRLGPGERLEIVARDAGAQADIPAWCRLTGHRLVSAEPPLYLIERGPA